MRQLLVLILFLLFALSSDTSFSASPIPVSDLVEGRSYYLLTAEIDGIGNAKEFQSKACPKSKNLFSFFFQNKVAISIHASYQLSSRASLIEEKELPILLVTNEAGKCTIIFALKEISPVFVPTQNILLGRDVWTFPVKLKVAVKNDFESGFINSLVALTNSAANFIGFQSGILTSLTKTTRAQAQLDITNFFSTQFDSEQVIELPAYSMDFRRPKKTIQISSIRASGGIKIPIKLNLKLERRQSVISSQPIGAVLKSAEFGEWKTKPITFGIDKTPITGLDIKNASLIAALKTSNRINWNDNCDKAKEMLVNVRGLNHTDAAFILARVILDETAEISNFDAPMANLMTCPGKLYIGEIARLGDDLKKLDDNAQIGKQKGREAKRQILNKAVVDMARAWKLGNKDLVADNLEHYLAMEVSLEDASLVLSTTSQFVTSKEINARQTIINLLSNLKLNEFGCFGVPSTIDYTVTNIYAELSPEKIGVAPRVALMTWTLDSEAIKSKSNFLTSVTLRTLSSIDEADRRLVQGEVLENTQCALAAKFNSFK